MGTIPFNKEYADGWPSGEMLHVPTSKLGINLEIPLGTWWVNAPVILY